MNAHLTNSGAYDADCDDILPPPQILPGENKYKLHMVGETEQHSIFPVEKTPRPHLVFQSLFLTCRQLPYFSTWYKDCWQCVHVFWCLFLTWFSYYGALSEIVFIHQCLYIVEIFNFQEDLSMSECASHFCMLWMLFFGTSHPKVLRNMCVTAAAHDVFVSITNANSFLLEKIIFWLFRVLVPLFDFCIPMLYLQHEKHDRFWFVGVLQVTLAIQILRGIRLLH